MSYSKSVCGVCKFQKKNNIMRATILVSTNSVSCDTASTSEMAISFTLLGMTIEDKFVQPLYLHIALYQ